MLPYLSIMIVPALLAHALPSFFTGGFLRESPAFYDGSTTVHVLWFVRLLIVFTMSVFFVMSFVGFGAYGAVGVVEAHLYNALVGFGGVWFVLSGAYNIHRTMLERERAIYSHAQREMYGE